MSANQALSAIVAAESAIRILIHVRNAKNLRADARFFIARHIAAIRVLRSIH